MQDPKRLSVFLLAFCLVFSLPFLMRPAAAESVWTLCRGGSPVGVVPIEKKGTVVLAAADVVAKVLRLQVEEERNEKLLIESHGRTLSLVDGSSAGFLDGSVVAFQNAVLHQEGHWWLDEHSLLSAFQSLLGNEARTTPLNWKKAGEPTPKTLSSKARIKGIRWGLQKDEIRAVVDLDEGVVVSVERQPGRIDVSASAVSGPDLSGLSSPWPDKVSVKATFLENRTILSFAYKTKRVKTSAMGSPSRFVLDFTDSAEAVTASIPQIPTYLPVQSAPPSFQTQVQGEGGLGEKSSSISNPIPQRGKKYVVVIDAGHGGNDPGAIGNGIQEKRINLEVALRLADRLRQMGFETRLTRTDDRFLKLGERTELANDWHADVFVSLHCNALPPGNQAQGIEIYLMALPTDQDALRLAQIENRDIVNSGKVDPSDKRTQLLLKILGDMQLHNKISESTTLAECLFRYGQSGGLPMKRVAQAPFYVLRDAAMPAVLVEMGFITDPTEAKLLASAEYQDKIARVIASGLASYLAP